MAADRPVPPSAARARLAAAAGLRPRAGWLTVGAWWLLVATLAANVAPSMAPLAFGEISGVDASEVAFAWASRLVAGTMILAGVALTVVVAVGWIGGTAGPVSDQARRRLGPVTVRAGATVPLVVGLVGLVAVAAALVGVMAGAARAPAASEAGLTALWSAWAIRVPLVVGASLIALGVVERWWSRRAITAALYQSRADARADRLRAGTGRRR